MADARMMQKKLTQLQAQHQAGHEGAQMAAGDGIGDRNNDKQKQQAKELDGQKKRDSFNIASMLVLLYFSTAMIVLPLGIYYIIYSFIIKSTTIAALGAVVMVQLIVAAFVYKAWHDEKTEAASNVPSSQSKTKSKDKKHS